MTTEQGGMGRRLWEQQVGPSHGTYGVMVVIATDQGAGRKYLCPCGWAGWSTWGHARKHAESCEQARTGGAP